MFYGARFWSKLEKRWVLAKKLVLRKVGFFSSSGAPRLIAKLLGYYELNLFLGGYFGIICRPVRVSP